MPYKQSFSHWTGKTVQVTNFSLNTVRGNLIDYAIDLPVGTCLLEPLYAFF